MKRLELPIGFQLASPWVPSLNRSLRGWVVSEKLDGVRAMWNGRGQLVSRNGFALKAPPEFTAGFPKGIVLDGELWIDRKMFADTVSVIRSRTEWSLVQYKVFDCFSKRMKRFAYSERFSALEERLADAAGISLHPSTQTIPDDSGALESMLERVLSLGGEGLILRDPTALYIPGRRPSSTSSILKLKPFLDEEAVVLEVNLHPGRRGSVRVQDRLGRVFSLASGFRDITACSPPAVGEVITFGFSSRHESSGLPRFPWFIRPRLDLGL